MVKDPVVALENEINRNQTSAVYKLISIVLMTCIFYKNILFVAGVSLIFMIIFKMLSLKYTKPKMNTFQAYKTLYYHNFYNECKTIMFYSVSFFILKYLLIHNIDLKKWIEITIEIFFYICWFSEISITAPDFGKVLTYWSSHEDKEDKGAKQ